MAAMLRRSSPAILTSAIVSLVCVIGTGTTPDARAEAPAAAATTAPPEPADMLSLFDGKDLDGWDGDPRLWSVKDGVIHGETTLEQPTAGNTFLIWTGGEVADFDLRLSFRCTATNNSGVQYRSRHITDSPTKNKWQVRGYQHELRNEETFPNVSGFIYDEGGGPNGRARICQAGEQATWEAEGGKKVATSLIDQESFKELMKVDDWNDIVIRAEGKHIRHYLNGRLILDFTDNDPTRSLSKGVVALQLHQGKPMWAEFRNIRLKSL
jgi:hypothetical protein